GASSTSTGDSGSGWQSGPSSAVRLAAMMPARRATARTSPFGTSPAAIAASVVGRMVTSPRASAALAVTPLAETSTMRARPRRSRCESREGRATTRGVSQPRARLNRARVPTADSVSGRVAAPPECTYSAAAMTAHGAPNHHRVLILGSGPAGLTAAIYAARANLAPTVVEGSQPGGQLTITTDVENYPGFAEGVLGPEMMEIFKKQASRFGTQFLYGDGPAADASQAPSRFEIGPEQHPADSLIIATGATAKLLGLPGEQRLMGYGVSACATCDGFFFKGKEVGVVGGGDTAMEEAIFLTKFATRVKVLHRRSELRASKIMQDRARKNDKIEFVWNVVVADVLGDAKNSGLTGVVLEDTKTGARRELPLDGLFVAIGHEPNTQLFKGKVRMDERGYIATEPRSTYTSVPGVFACGAAQDPTYRQAVTAAGSGCMAAIDAERWLEAQHD